MNIIQAFLHPTPPSFYEIKSHKIMTIFTVSLNFFFNKNLQKYTNYYSDGVVLTIETVYPSKPICEIEHVRQKMRMHEENKEDAF